MGLHSSDCLRKIEILVMRLGSRTKKAALVRFIAPSIADGVNENDGIISGAADHSAE
jgi:hypothetical protein